MTLTDFQAAVASSQAVSPAPPTAVAPAESSEMEARRPASGFVRPVMTGDHAVIGRLFVAVSLLFAVGASVIGLMLGWKRGEPDAGFLGMLSGGVNSWFQLWTLYRAGIILLVLMPLMLGLAMAVVPSQVGAAGLAFPRAALASFWSWLVGSVILLASVAAGGGWGALDGVTPGERDAIALTLLGTALAIAALLLGAIVVAATVISLREHGLSLLEVPPFAWSMLVASAVWLFTLPVAVANIVLIYADLRGRDPISFGEPEGGGIWFQLDWLTEQPAVYALAVPVLGIAAQTAGAVSGSRSARPAVIAAAVGLFGLLSVGGWSQDFFDPADDAPAAAAEPARAEAGAAAAGAGTADGGAAGDRAAGDGHRDELVYVAFGLGALLPVLAVAGGAADSLRQGGARSLAGLGSTRLLAAAASLMLLAGAAFSGALRVIEPFRLLERSTNTGIFNAVAAAGLAAGAAGLWHWSPQLFGAPAPEIAGRVATGLLAAGGVLLAGPDVVSGFLGAADLPMAGATVGAPPTRTLIAAGDNQGAVDALNAVSAVGSAIVVVGLVAAAAGVLQAMTAGSRAGAASSAGAEAAAGARP